jgi:hypothetical protein
MVVAVRMAAAAVVRMVVEARIAVVEARIAVVEARIAAAEVAAPIVVVVGAEARTVVVGVLTKRFLEKKARTNFPCGLFSLR